MPEETKTKTKTKTKPEGPTIYNVPKELWLLRPGQLLQMKDQVVVINKVDSKGLPLEVVVRDENGKKTIVPFDLSQFVKVRR